MGNSVLSLHMRVPLCTWEPQCLAGFPGISEFFCQLTVSFLWREKRMVKVPWRYKCSFHWLNNNSLSQWSDKNLSSSFHIPHLCVDFSLQCEPGWQSVMAWWNCVKCCARLPVPGVPEERELQVTLGEGCLKNCWHFSALYSTVFADVLLCYLPFESS